MYLLCLGGLIGILSTGDAFNAFVFLEISSLATYVIISMGNDRRGLLAAYQYLIIGTIGATLYVIGVGLIFIITGSLNLYDISIKLADIELYRPLLASLAFITVGIALKIALFLCMLGYLTHTRLRRPSEPHSSPQQQQKLLFIS